MTTEAVCDACAERGRCVVQGDAYVCEKCVAHHERALDFAGAAITLNYGIVTSAREVAIVAVEAYLGYAES